MPGRDSAENCGVSAVFVLVGDADNMVDLPVLCMLGFLSRQYSSRMWMLTCPFLCTTAALGGPDSAVLGRGR